MFLSIQHQYNRGTLVVKRGKIAVDFLYFTVESLWHIFRESFSRQTHTG